MSLRQPQARRIGSKNMICLGTLNFPDSNRLKVPQKHGGEIFCVERVTRPNTEKEAAAGRFGKLRQVKQRKVGARKSTQGERAEKSSARSQQHRKLKKNRNKGWPAIQRPAANVRWIVDCRNVVLHRPGDRGSQEAADQDDGRDKIGTIDNFVERLNGV